MLHWKPFKNDKKCFLFYLKSSICPQDNKNKLYKTLDYWSKDILNFSFREKVLGLVAQSHFEYDFSQKNASYIIFYQLTKFYCLIAFTSRDIGQYVFQNWLLTRLWRHKIWNLIKSFAAWPKSHDKYWNTFRTKRGFDVK